MILRYSRKELVKIWSEENKYKIWLDVEIAAAQAMEKYKIIPKGISAIVKKKGKIKFALFGVASYLLILGLTYYMINGELPFDLSEIFILG